jgi:hypothetical protein
MAISVDIADRLYDYMDEERAAQAVAEFQDEAGLDDHAMLSLWRDENDGRRLELESRIFKAIDDNGSAKRAAESVPAEINLLIED